jgi:hypothetical protein
MKEKNCVDIDDKLCENCGSPMSGDDGEFSGRYDEDDTECEKCKRLDQAELEYDISVGK